MCPNQGSNPQPGVSGQCSNPLSYLARAGYEQIFGTRKGSRETDHRTHSLKKVGSSGCVSWWREERRGPLSVRSEEMPGGSPGIYEASRIVEPDAGRAQNRQEASAVTFLCVGDGKSEVTSWSKCGKCVSEGWHRPCGESDADVTSEQRENEWIGQTWVQWVSVRLPLTFSFKGWPLSRWIKLAFKNLVFNQRHGEKFRCLKYFFLKLFL